MMMKKKRNNIFYFKIKLKSETESESEKIQNIISIFIGQSFIWRKNLNVVLSHLKFTDKKKKSKKFILINIP